MIIRRALLGMLVSAFAVAGLEGCASDSASPSIIHAVASGTAGTYHIPPGSESWLARSTLLTIYGRGFGIAPILGRLGIDRNFADLAAQTRPYVSGIRRNNGGRRVIIAVHLIYGLAMPCADSPRCLLYLDDTGVNIIKQYIRPAARRHWLVILDTQLGSSNPVIEVERMIHKGYLRYDNVEVALDPEFHVVPGYQSPGLPFGSVTAYGINLVQKILNRYVARHDLPHKKIVLLHQFLFSMIVNRARIRRFPHVDVVINADGSGPPGLKAETYDALLGAGAGPGVEYRGIKLFLRNPYTPLAHTDVPSMVWPQVFGRWPMFYLGHRYWIRPPPSVVVIA